MAFRTEAKSAAPAWTGPWLAALPAFYVFSPLAVLALPQLRLLPPFLWWLLGFYMLSQQIPALFAPEPLLASALALARTLLMFGLMGVGVSLGRSDRLRAVAWGLGAVYITALLFTVLGGTDLVIQRLSHPYMTTTTLGMAGALGIWLTIFSRGDMRWRLPIGVIALGVLLLSGGRGPWLAAFVGLLAGMMVQPQRRVLRVAVGGVALLLGALVLGQRQEIAAITRLTQTDTTGRDLIWTTALSVIQSQPWTGVGSYRLGKRLAPPSNQCELFPSAQGESVACPAWVEAIGQPWLIAHNVTLQQLAETGPVGLLGLFLLLGVVVAGTFKGRDPLSAAIVSGLLVATANDNTLLVPSPMVAEVFWVVAGIQLVRMPQISALSGVYAAGLMLVLSLPVLSLALPANKLPNSGLTFLQAPGTVRQSQPYQTYALFDIAPDTYRAVLRACLSSCSIVSSSTFQVQDRGSPLVVLSGQLLPATQQRLELLLYPSQSRNQVLPLARRTWTVKVVP